jgi:hypothetical protein
MKRTRTGCEPRVGAIRAEPSKQLQAVQWRIGPAELGLFGSPSRHELEARETQNTSATCARPL